MTAILPSAVLVEVEFTAGVWTDIASSVVADSIEIKVGRESAQSDDQPGTLTLLIDNATGEWTPDNPTSARYPNWIEGKRIRVRVTKSATTYPRFVGRITSIVPDFPDDPSQSKVQVAAVDLLGDLAAMEIANSAVEYLIRRADLGARNCVFPLDDTGTAREAREARFRTASLLVRSTATGGAVEWQGSEFLGMPAVKLTAGKGLSGGSTSSPVGDAYGLVITVFVEDNSYGEVVAITTGARTGASDGILVRWTSSGFILDDFAGGVVVSSSSAVAVDPGWHVIAIDGTTGTTAQLRVDSTVVAGITDTSTTGYTVLSVGGSLNMSACLLAWGAQIPSTARAFSSAGAVIFSEIIDNGSTSLFDVMVGLADLDGESNLAGNWFSGVNPSPLLDVETNGLDMALKIARSLGGRVYHAYSTAAPQLLQFDGTNVQRPTTVALTIDAENDAAGGPVVARDSAAKARAATATSPSATVTYADTAQTSGGSPAEVETYVNEPEALLAIAQDVTARSASNRLRVSQVTIDLAGAVNDLYATWFAVTPGERVRLSNLSSTYFGVTYMDGYVEGWTERPSINDYTVTLDLSPADAPTEGVWDTDRWGWGDGVCTLSGSLTSSATSLTLTWTGTATMSTSAGDYPLDIDVNGERITLPSAPAGGTSPRTFTGVTRGVAPTVARAHSSAEPVDIWNAFRWAM